MSTNLIINEGNFYLQTPPPLPPLNGGALPLRRRRRRRLRFRRRQAPAPSAFPLQATRLNSGRRRGSPNLMPGLPAPGRGAVFYRWERFLLFPLVCCFRLANSKFLGVDFLKKKNFSVIDLWSSLLDCICCVRIFNYLLFQKKGIWSGWSSRNRLKREDL